MDRPGASVREAWDEQARLLSRRCEGLCESVLDAREVELWPKEVTSMQQSGRALEDTWRKLD